MATPQPLCYSAVVYTAVSETGVVDCWCAGARWDWLTKELQAARRQTSTASLLVKVVERSATGTCGVVDVCCVWFQLL
jgi:hypothetical protein